MDNQDLIYRHKTPVQIRMTDLDPFGHVNNGVIYAYYDVGRLHYLGHLNDPIQWEKMDKVLVHTSCDFREAILFEDKISVETKITAIGNKSITMMQRIVDDNTGKIKSVCLSILSGYDRTTNTSKPITSAFKEKAEMFEAQKF
ncbi:MAG: acyl-CoA thioesterase [Bacteroidales bacterium]|jgi:acyl-CoA thioester hydrolase|nr:acyl-CoA thioesterase [Bacteroidales bacterium]